MHSSIDLVFRTIGGDLVYPCEKETKRINASQRAALRKLKEHLYGYHFKIGDGYIEMKGDPKFKFAFEKKKN